MTTPPAPHSDQHTFAVLDDALAALTDRRGLRIGDDAVLIHLLANLIDQAQRRLPEAVFTARANGASRDDIAALLATSPHEARLRFDPDPPIADGRWPTDYRPPPQLHTRRPSRAPHPTHPRTPRSRQPHKHDHITTPLPSLRVNYRWRGGIGVCP